MKTYKVIRHTASESEDVLEKELNAATRDDYRVTDIIGAGNYVYAICTKDQEVKIGGKLGT